MQNNKKLLLGMAKVDITPDNPVFLAGFCHRKGRSEGVKSNLYSRISIFVDQENVNNKFLLIQADLIWFGDELVEKYKRIISKKYNIPGSAIVFHASHTHSGPQTSEKFSKLLGVYESGCVENIMGKIMSGIDIAMDNIEEVNIFRGIGNCNIGINRRKVINGTASMAPNEDGLVDNELNVILFETASGNIKGLLFHYSCHPTVTDSNFISSEFCGVAAEKIEKWLHDNTVVTFLQGFCGDVRPKLVQNNEFYRGSEKDVEKFANQLFEEVKLLLTAKMEHVEYEKITIDNRQINLKLNSIPSYEDLCKEIPNEECYITEWKRSLRSKERIEPEIPLDITCVKISRNLGFIFVNAEVVCDYGIFVKQASNGSILPVGYSNGMIGYIPTESQLKEGGYEAETSIYYFALPSTFDSCIEEDIKNTLNIMINNTGI